MLRLAVLLSGSGTNLQAIIDACHERRLDAQVVVVAANKARARGLMRAERAGIPTRVHSRTQYRQAATWRDQYDVDLANLLQPFHVDLVVLAGWMHILGPTFLDAFAHRVINLHPALPGQFRGAHAIEDAYSAFRQGDIRHTGVMVHWVIPEVDAGSPIAQATVEIFPNDSLESLTHRIHQVEHALIVAAIASLSNTVSEPGAELIDVENNT